MSIKFEQKFSAFNFLMTASNMVSLYDNMLNTTHVAVSKTEKDFSLTGMKLVDLVISDLSPD